MGVGRIGLLAMAIMALWTLPACKDREDPKPISETDGADLDDTDADTEGTKGGETYADYDARRDEKASPRAAEGYGCTDDCGGHDAGYQWAEDHSVSDESECGGKSWSFEEGCVAYAKEQEPDADDDPDGS